MELIDGRKDKIAARVGRHLRGQWSGIAAEFEYWAVFMFRDGKVLRIEWFADRGEALGAVGCGSRRWVNPDMSPPYLIEITVVTA
jgi:hypothetical protein